MAVLKQRLLAMMALETARIVEEKVLTDPREGDVCGILGFGFAPYTGGPLSYIDGMGTADFVSLCKKLQKTCGARFKPNRQLITMAKDGDTFYGSMASQDFAA
jgi:3-hydroxyacyl-CoA dehydrogenase / enoyl-CoA hydratase / 3-hydroxybutyryl-CoA epimerase